MVATCGIGNIVGVTTVINATFSAFLIPVTDDFGWPRSEFSFVLTILSLMGVVFYPLAGRLMDRVGRRPVALVGNVLFGASIMALSAMPRSQAVAYGLFALVGMAATLPSTVLFARVVSTWFEARRGLALGLSGGLAFGLGGMTVPVFAQALIQMVGWREAYLGLGALVIAVGFPAFWFGLHENDGAVHRGQDDGAIEPERSFLRDASIVPREAVRTRAFRLLFVSVAAGSGSIAAITTHMGPIAAENGLAPMAGIVALGGLYLANAVWQIAVGLVLDRTRTPRLAAPFVLTAVIGTLILTQTHTPGMVMLAAILIGLGCGTEYGLLPFCIPRYFGFRYYGEIYGWIFGAIMLFQGVTPFVMDVLYERTGSYHAPVLLIGAILIACSGLLLGLPGYRFGRAVDS
ncbi:major facilitator superfamily MFS_1 [Novosphingobium nitrogenifigens DSM 19370]|uniref:Major facilitator superfamily MFS_1 n=1 Tax=Novosphingobium nitrogenifigens DSM 19370 TaxID=983920 RepID=F1ZB53_9SPHN|nr:major facilitator superfamily MFS_1 [Novosphingobium nitrogenifigens DSM 19370]